MNSLDKARDIIARALEGAKSPIVCWSGAKDSQLLLKLASEVRDDIPVLWFRSVDPARNKFAERFIAETDLMVYSWEPMDRYVLPNGEGMSLIEDFSFGSLRLPLVSDIAPGTKCAVHTPKDRVSFVNYGFDITLVGVKASDSHSLVRWHERKGFVAPLWEMTDAEVWEAIRDLEISVEEPGQPDGPQLCTNCLVNGLDEVYCPEVGKMIPRFVWDSNAAVAAFHSRFAA